MFDLDEFIAGLREAAACDDAAKRVRALMTEAFRDPAAIRGAMSAYTGEEEILFEDDSISIWYCGFDPARHVPPHDHQTSATIGVYQGGEKNHFYIAAEGRLEYKTTKTVGAGDVIALGPDAIHSVETVGADPSYAIHVYLAPLRRIERSLFDWETGAREPFTDEAYARLERASGGAVEQRS